MRQSPVLIYVKQIFFSEKDLKLPLGLVIPFLFMSRLSILIQLFSKKL